MRKCIRLRTLLNPPATKLQVTNDVCVSLQNKFCNRMQTQTQTQIQTQIYVTVREHKINSGIALTTNTQKCLPKHGKRVQHR
jgi:hypothetical protein